MVAIIIDDESKARNLLKNILEEFCPEIKTVVEANDLPSGVMAINKNKPDVVFLDVEMPGYAGTQILDFFDEAQIKFQIIFTTAYQEYALKAFELSAISYLLKPLRPSQVKEAVAKVSEIKSSEQINTQLKELNNALSSRVFEKIGLPITDGILFVKLDEIFYLKAEGMYTNVMTENGGVQLISKPLKYFVNLLKEIPGFYRTHRSYLINKRHINQVVKKEGGYILMDNGDSVSVSKEKLNELLKLLNYDKYIS